MNDICLLNSAKMEGKKDGKIENEGNEENEGNQENNAYLLNCGALTSMLMSFARFVRYVIVVIIVIIIVLPFL